MPTPVPCMRLLSASKYLRLGQACQQSVSGGAGWLMCGGGTGLCGGLPGGHSLAVLRTTLISA